MPESRPGFYLGTSIDGVHINAERLNVRARDLNDLIGRLSFTEALFHILQGRMPTEQEQKLFDIVLVAFHGGFGLLPPTTLIPRLVAGTGVCTAQALAAGYLASGPFHVGAAELAMQLYGRIAGDFQKKYPGETTAGQLEQFSWDAAASQVEVGQMIGGFGHPLLRKDPRPVHMRRLVCELGVEGPYFDIYDGITRCLREKKGISPNVDGIAAAILCHLGFQPAHGTGLFLLARTAAMLAHIVEEQTEMPYQTMKRFMLLPIAAPRVFNANFRKIAKRFNTLRDSRIWAAFRGLVKRRSGGKPDEKEAADLAAIAEHRARRNTEPVAAPNGLSSQESDASKLQTNGNSRPVQGSSADEPLDWEGLLAGADSRELLAAASLFLSACLREGAADATPESSQLVSSALELVRQASSRDEAEAGDSVPSA